MIDARAIVERFQDLGYGQLKRSNTPGDLPAGLFVDHEALHENCVFLLELCRLGGQGADLAAELIEGRATQPRRMKAAQKVVGDQG